MSVDTSGVPTRDAKRRGAGWLPGLADIGWSNRLGWYEGFHVILAVNPLGRDHGVWLWGRQHQRPAPGRHLFCPPPLSATGSGKERGPQPRGHMWWTKALKGRLGHGVATALWGRCDLSAETQ